MKTSFFIFALIAATLCFYGCEKTSSDDQNNPSDEKTDGGTNENGGDGTVELPDLPDLEDVDDVCTKMTDINFMAFCYDNFDVNHDGKVSMVEANAVKTISCSTAEDFTGIGYFSNLESFESTSAKYLDLRYNAKLTDVHFYVYSSGGHSKSAPIEELDLRYCLSMTEIGEEAFHSCKNLTKIDLPSSLIKIDEDAFGYSGLTSIDLPSELLSIGKYAFHDCTSLKTVTSRAVTPPSVAYTSNGSSSDTFDSCSFVLYVPEESVSEYRSASGWSHYATSIEAISE